MTAGADNFYDAGSCIDGRLTSAWNWCSQARSLQIKSFDSVSGVSSNLCSVSGVLVVYTVPVVFPVIYITPVVRRRMRGEVYVFRCSLGMSAEFAHFAEEVIPTAGVDERLLPGLPPLRVHFLRRQGGVVRLTRGRDVRWYKGAFRAALGPVGSVGPAEVSTVALQGRCRLFEFWAHQLGVERTLRRGAEAAPVAAKLGRGTKSH